MGTTKISPRLNHKAFLEGLESLNNKKQERFVKAPKLEVSKVDKRKSMQLGQVWEFENYVRERLRALGIIQ